MDGYFERAWHRKKKNNEFERIQEVLIGVTTLILN